MPGPLLQSYLFFNGNTQEAIDFYCKAIGATVEMVLKFKDSPDPLPPDMLAPGYEDKVMHAAIHIGDQLLMMSDGCEPGQAFAGFSLSLSVKTPEEVDRLFANLSEGGKVTMPLGKTFWSPRFGMLVDRFGVGWMVGI